MGVNFLTFVAEIFRETWGGISSSNVKKTSDGMEKIGLTILYVRYVHLDSASNVTQENQSKKAGLQVAYVVLDHKERINTMVNTIWKLVWWKLTECWHLRLFVADYSTDEQLLESNLVPDLGMINFLLWSLVLLVTREIQTGKETSVALFNIIKRLLPFCCHGHWGQELLLNFSIRLGRLVKNGSRKNNNCCLLYDFLFKQRISVSLTR